MIASKNVLNGGLNSAECERRWWIENGGGLEKRRSGGSKRMSGRSSGRRHKRASKQTSWRDAETQVYPVQQDVDVSFRRPQSQRIQSWRGDVPVGYVGELSPALPPRPGMG